MNAETKPLLRAANGRAAPRRPNERTDPYESLRGNSLVTC